jgi:hypothetical protein
MSKALVFVPTLETKYIHPELAEKIKQINLTLIRDRMIIKHGWSEEETDKAIEAYRKFLYLTQVFEESLAPTLEIDEVWHEHILHTNKYAIDCQKTFGKFLDHFPTPAKWTQKKVFNSKKTIEAGCAGGECEGSCSNDSCDSGTTNCQGRKKRVKINYDNPVEEGHHPAVNFKVIERKFFS